MEVFKKIELWQLIHEEAKLVVRGKKVGGLWKQRTKEN
jgi:hypothetical protein